MVYEIFKIIRRAVFRLTTKERIICSTSNSLKSTQTVPDIYMENPSVNDMALTEQTANVSIKEQMSFDRTSQKRHRMDESRPLWLSYGKRISGSTGPISEQKPLGLFSLQRHFGTLSKPRLIVPLSVQRPFGTLSVQRPFGLLRWLRPVGPLRWLRTLGPFSWLRTVGTFSRSRAVGPFSRPRAVGPLRWLRTVTPLSPRRAVVTPREQCTQDETAWFPLVFVACVVIYLCECVDTWRTNRTKRMSKADITEPVSLCKAEISEPVCVCQADVSESVSVCQANVSESVSVCQANISESVSLCEANDSECVGMRTWWCAWVCLCVWAYVWR